ncbi:hypothetical protein FQP90_09030 [Paenarthrobacter nitroguajacolicus]|uniref:Uncharacterized protein n=1 Tax=Paenarthrobacter nitroguajacolicus TaxID=211146 RepID=A0A558H4R6_PAENT|nr:hypothetical protein [Paenarthrobacter nitroguajacolicus]TVU64118.1 hypothetical protein FQP90_09030 [Paenarthrobacter nitroguajacolicus]
MKRISRKNANSYWLILAGCYGLTIGIATMTAMPWLLIVGGVFIVFPLVVGFVYGQIGSKVQYQLVPERPMIVIAATAFAVVATLLHGSPVAVWAGPFLAVATFVGMYFCLRRYGHFHGIAQDSPDTSEAAEHLGQREDHLIVAVQPPRHP